MSRSEDRAKLPNSQGDVFEAGLATLRRAAVPLVLWVARIVASQSSESAAGISCILLIDALLIVAHAWANRPLKNALGDNFGWNFNYSAIPYTGWLIAVLLFGRDLIFTWLGKL